MLPPNIAADKGAREDNQLPYPDGKEYNPVAPQDELVQTQGKQQAEDQQTAIYQEFTAQECIQ